MFWKLPINLKWLQSVRLSFVDKIVNNKKTEIIIFISDKVVLIFYSVFDIFFYFTWCISEVKALIRVLMINDDKFGQNLPTNSIDENN